MGADLVRNVRVGLACLPTLAYTSLNSTICKASLSSPACSTLYLQEPADVNIGPIKTTRDHENPLCPIGGEQRKAGEKI